VSSRDLTVAVIGAGVSGLAMAMRLQDAGVPYTVFEKAGEVGGTWRDNRYPGLTIDVPSPLYTFSAHRHPGWRRWMPGGQEILDYHRDVSVRSGVRPHIRFDAEVTELTWLGDRWELATRDGHRETFDVVVCASGFLHHPRWPDIPGLDAFAGDVAHSARWDDAIAVRGRRVGVIGTGSTGVQLVSALGGVASHLTHFQRTPQWIFPGPNFTIPGAVRAALARHPQVLDPVVEAIERFADHVVGGAATRPGLRRRVFDTIARLHLRTVRDPDLRARLTPEEEPLCRRPVLSSRFYRAVQRPDVEVVTTPIDHVRAGGVVTADGRLHELDVLICATGFEAHNYMRPMAITGEDGLTLEDAWADGPHGYRTVALSGFPNLFMLMGPHSPLVSIAIHASAELQAGYVMQMLDVIGQEDVVSVAPTPAATERWMAFVRDGMPGTIWTTGCASWYVGGGETPVLWPYDRRRWFGLLREPELADYAVRRAPAAAPAR
jgi:cation diffusion facilitator CzcD-associated flavoprotein CzcO